LPGYEFASNGVRRHGNRWEISHAPCYVTAQGDFKNGTEWVEEGEEEEKKQLLSSPFQKFLDVIQFRT